MSEDDIGPVKHSMIMMNQSLPDNSLQSYAAEMEEGGFLVSDSFPDSNRCNFMLNF